MIFVFLSLTYFTITDFRFIHVITNHPIPFLFWLGNITLCIRTTSFLSIHFVHGHIDCEAYHIFNVCKVMYFLIGEDNGTPLQYSCLENHMDGGAWWAAVHGVVKSRTRLNNFTFTFHFHWRRKW